jgi:hypothetical protein
MHHLWLTMPSVVDMWWMSCDAELLQDWGSGQRVELKTLRLPSPVEVENISEEEDMETLLALFFDNQCVNDIYIYIYIYIYAYILYISSLPPSLWCTCTCLMPFVSPRSRFRMQLDKRSFSPPSVYPSLSPDAVSQRDAGAAERAGQDLPAPSPRAWRWELLLQRAHVHVV